MKVKVTQSCPVLCDPMEHVGGYSLITVHRLLLVVAYLVEENRL